MNRVECRVLRVERQRMLRSEELARSEEREARSENQSARQRSLRADSSLFPVPHSPFPVSASPLLAPRSSRQRRPGVLLLVVLSMLVLFMLVGTAFLMTADQSRVSSKSNAKKDRLGNVATQDLTRALMQLLRDTENPYAATYTHSILRDFYGTDGFRGQVQIVPTTAPFVPGNLPQEVTRYAAATPPPNELGPTQGQFIDIYFTSIVPNPGDTIDIRHTPKIDLNVLGQPQAYVLPLTKGYFNGQLLTVTSGPAAGQTTRILDYEHLGSATSGTGPNQRPLHFFRMRVMAFGRADGNSLTINTTTNHAPEITDLAGATFLVNGRPFSGTGVGYNPLARTDPVTQAVQARLSALEILQPFAGGDPLGAELALLPNARYFNPLSAVVGSLNVPNPFNPIPTPQTTLAFINNPNGLYTGTPLLNYPHYVGAGGANEGYDAADFQNMWLALQTVTPRNQGRVVSANGIFDVSDYLTNPGAAGDFRRLDLEDLPLPSFHRPDLVNFWYHRLLTLLISPPQNQDSDDAVQAILRPYGVDGIRGTADDPGIPVEQLDLIVAIKRRIMMRPIREDHPNFDGGNPQSQFDYRNVSTFFLNGIGVPYWEAVGPWDVDNDNDGVADSVWIDMGDPVLEMEDGTRYKKMVAALVIDLDSRLNVNANGLVDHINPPNLAYAQYVQGNGTIGPLVLGYNLAGVMASGALPRGLGMGPAETSLRPVFPQPWATPAGALDYNANRSEANPQPIDDYAAIFVGRARTDRSAVSGKYGYLWQIEPGRKPTPGINYEHSVQAGTYTGETNQPDLAAQLKFFDFPWSIMQRSAYGTPPDLMGRYALGLDYTGQPYYEVLNDLNPNNNWARALLTDSPYELNLSSPQRRDTEAAMYIDGDAAFNTSLGQNDDAPYSLSDLERVLRAWDADSGTLPSRLWDVVNAFDPLKLMQFDPNRIAGLASANFGTTNPSQPELLATAQQLAGMNRRLVTTDSFTPPVPSVNAPAYLLQAPEGITDPAQHVLYQQAINRHPPKSVAEMLELRIRREMGWPVPPTAFDDFDPNGDHNLDTIPNSTDPQYNQPNANAAQAARTARAAQISAITQQLLAPEVIAGKRMDLNRPFGDGRDNAGDGRDNNNNGLIDEPGEAGDPFNMANGVVDDPMEAGDPFLDVNGNGKWENGEPYIDLDGDGSYSPPRDQMWADLTAQGRVGESIAFDYTNGALFPLHPAVSTAVATALNIPPAQMASASVRNLDSQGRQLYARHLYCLMLLLVDEGYIAPWDANDPQIREYLDTSIANSYAANLLAAVGNDAQEARRILLRKLTCQAIAQWAINAVDTRDADAIMTPFEYDENPWDGWGVMGESGLMIPIDGDPATDENLGEVIDWREVNDSSDFSRFVNPRDLPRKYPPPNTPPPLITGANLPGPLNQTRGIVWGAERPDLLITETLAFHDHRCEDLSIGGLIEDRSGQPADEDLDQRLRPRGSLFVELYNPWSPTGQFPAEIYSLFNSQNGGLVDRNGDGQIDANDIVGVELGRLSTFGVEETANGLRLTSSLNVKRSPVWRMIVVEEHPGYRQNPNNYPVDDETVDQLGTQIHKDSPNPKWYSGFFRPADPDKDSMFSSQGWPNTTAEVADNEPYIERAIYFTSDDSERLGYVGADPITPEENALSLNPNKINEKLHLPRQFAPLSANYFIATDASLAPTNTQAVTTGDVKIAPIKPGRFAVIGTAGVQYEGKQTGSVQNSTGQTLSAPRYVTTLSRAFYQGDDRGDAQDDATLQGLDLLPRIEMRPHANPEFQQLFVASNGGTPLFPRAPGLPTTVARRDNEVVRLPDGSFRNIYHGGGTPPMTVTATTPYTVVPDSQLIPPIVAVPIKDLSISEPLDLYAARRQALNGLPIPGDPDSASQTRLYFDPKKAHGEGRFVMDGGLNGVYFRPFDRDRNKEFYPEIGTTPNYRTIHLQRLADPTLPWNPMPYLPDGKDNPQHDSNLPVNVYRTIDTSSVDLTVYNGASRKDEGRKLPLAISQDGNAQYRREFGDANAPRRIHFRSSERGAHAKDTVAAADDLQVAARALWRQEPINLLTHMQVWKDLDAAGRVTELLTRSKDLRQRPQYLLSEDIRAVNSQLSNELQNFPDSLRSKEDPTAQEPALCFDFVLDHSLGFANEAFGAMISRTDLQANGLPVTADGTPTPDLSDFTRSDAPPSLVMATYPWLAWNNRPFVSAGELLNVPAQSSSQLLRKYSTLNNAVQASSQGNPYNGNGVTNAERLVAVMSPFGHLLSAFQSSTIVSGIARNLDGSLNLDNDGNWQFVGAPHYYRILDYVHVPSRFVGTDTMLTAEVFNDVPGVNDAVNTPGIAMGSDFTGPQDPRVNFQPPFNKVSRERDPGKINLNTVTGRRTAVPGAPPKIWSEVFDGLMHRVHDDNPSPAQWAHGGPAWRDVVLSRRGYFDPNTTASSDRAGVYPDTIGSLLHPYLPTMFANPFRSPNAGDLVPLNTMVQHAGINTTFQRAHHYAPADPASATINAGWGQDGVDDDGDGLIDDAREAGMGNDTPASTLPLSPAESRIPLFAENAINPAIDGNRNPAMMYQPMTRLENLVTNRSNVFAIWITVGYFEVEPAPNWETNEGGVRDRFNNDLNLYNRVYPDGYMLGKEVGSDTGNVQRPRGFYIVDRTEEVGFKPGEDLNVERAIKLRRRIE